MRFPALLSQETGHSKEKWWQRRQSNAKRRNKALGKFIFSTATCKGKITRRKRPATAELPLWKRVQTTV